MAGPGYYLCTCLKPPSNPTGGISSQEGYNAALFYANISLEKDHPPFGKPSFNLIAILSGPGVGAWEGTGNTTDRNPDSHHLEWSISGTHEENANLPDRTKVGTATDGKEKWLVFKSDGAVVFTDADGFECRRKYFAMFGEPVGRS